MESISVIPITDLRRDAARIIDGAVVSGAPVFITRNGRAIAVLVSRELFDDLLQRDGPQGDGRPAQGDQTGAAAAHPPAPLKTTSQMLAAPAAPVETKFGFCDPTTGAFLIEEGFEPEIPTPAASGDEPVPVADETEDEV